MLEEMLRAITGDELSIPINNNGSFSASLKIIKT
jgi:hypothetical protein